MLGEIKNHEPEEADPKIMEMACNVCAALKNATSYLIYGEMLPTEELPVPGMDIYIQGLDFGFKRKSITVPSVLSMFWKNPAGKIACALANVSDETKVADIQVGSYLKIIRKVLVEVNGYEQRYWGNIVKGNVRLKMSARSAAVVREERWSMDRMLRNRKAIVFFVAPAFVLFTVVLLIPILQMLYYSLCDYNALKEPVFIGLDNFKTLLFEDKTMRMALKNSLFFMIFSYTTCETTPDLIFYIISITFERFNKNYESISLLAVVEHYSVDFRHE